MDSSSEALLDAYRSAAMEHGLALHLAESERANRAFRLLRQCLQAIDNAMGRKSLTGLLDDGDPHVALWAGTHLLATSPTVAELALERLAALPAGVAASDAQTVLAEWRAGRLTPSE